MFLLFAAGEGMVSKPFGLVKGTTFANPAAHPHPNYMGVPPGQASHSFFISSVSVAVITAKL